MSNLNEKGLPGLYLNPLLKKIRTNNGKDVSFYYLCSELVEADYGKDRLTKELLSKIDFS